MDDFERQLALTTHQRDAEAQARMTDSALNFAVMAVKSIILIAGGSVVVGLAFVGTIYTSDKDLAKSLITPIFLLALGAILAASCAGFSYITQWLYAEASYRKEYSFTHPYVTAKPTARAWIIAGQAVHVISVAVALASLASLCVGLWQAHQALS